MVTIEDIAKQAGVSFSTVSRALSGSPLVNEVTRRKIQRIAAEVGYQPNQVARSLAMRSTRTVGLIVPEVHNPYYPKLIQLVADHSRNAGYTLQLHLSHADQRDEQDCLRVLRERRADGIILATGTEGLVATDEVALLRENGVPVVLMGWVAGDNVADMVMGDDASGAYAMTQHLLQLGHRRIVMVGGKETRGPYDRIRGFLQALDEAGLNTGDNLILNIQTEDDVRAVLVSLLEQSSRPTAIFAYQDVLAAWIMRCLSDYGVHVPDQIAVVGFDNLDLASYLNPQLTTVDYPIEAFSQKAVSLLLERLKPEAPDRPPQRHLFTPHLIVRQSCGAHSAS